MRLRASAVSLTLGLRLERLLEVLGVNTCLGSLFPSHLRSLRSVHFYELRFGWASGEGKEVRALSDVRASDLATRVSLPASFVTSSPNVLRQNCFARSMSSKRWWTRGDSNPRPPHCERGKFQAKTRCCNHLAFATGSLVGLRGLQSQIVGMASHTVSAASSTMWAETVLRRQFDSRERMRIRTQRLTDTRGGCMMLGREEKGIGKFMTSQAPDLGSIPGPE